MTLSHTISSCMLALSACGGGSRFFYSIIINDTKIESPMIMVFE